MVYYRKPPARAPGCASALATKAAGRSGRTQEEMGGPGPHGRLPNELTSQRWVNEASTPYTWLVPFDT